MDILLIEDEQPMAKLYKKKLKCDVVEKYTEFTPYDLFILDMKTESDLEVKEQIHQIKEHSDSPIWILSNYEEDYIKQKIAPFEVNKILLKLDYTPGPLKKLIDEIFT